MTGACFARGHYRLEVTEALVEFVERTFVAPLAPEKRASARAEAARELATAELVLETGNTLISRADGVESLRVRLPEGAFHARILSFEKAPGVEVRLECVSAEVVLAFHPGKPPLTFRRIETY